MAIAKTYARTFISDFLFHVRKWRTNLKDFSFYNFTFLADYYRNIHNGEIVCLRRHLPIPYFTRRCQNFTLAPFIILNMDGQVSKIRLRTKRSQWMRASRLYIFCSDNFYVWELHLNSDVCHSHLHITGKFELVFQNFNIKRFLLCFAWNSDPSFSNLHKTL